MADNVNGSSEPSSEKKEPVTTCLQKWRNLVTGCITPFENLMVTTASISAKHPLPTVFFITILSFGLAITGFLTNYVIETNNNVLFSPTSSITDMHFHWSEDPEQSGFTQNPEKVLLLVHANGQDVTNVEGMKHVFEAQNAIIELPKYKDNCIEIQDGIDVLTCRIESVTGFWDNHNQTLFEESVESDEDVKTAISHMRYADGSFANRFLTIGNSLPDITVEELNRFLLLQTIANGGDMFSIFSDEEKLNGIFDVAAERFEVEFAESYIIAMNTPDILARDLAISDAILALNEKWKENGDNFRVTVTTLGSTAAEIVRSITDNFPLLVGAFLIMTLFTTYSLSQCDKVKSQTLLGIGAIVTIFLSLLASYGFMFLIGVPFTSLTYLFPYAMIGLGLDGTFIIMGSLHRKSEKNIVKRIEETIREIGLSIAISTLTTVVAYLLGSTSAMPGIRWFCFYAALCIVIAFIYHFTFFVALIVLDQKRQDNNRMDCLLCVKVTNISDTVGEAEPQPEKPSTSDTVDEAEPQPEKPSTSDTVDEAEPQPEKAKKISQKFMSKYASFLLQQWTKAFVVVLFTGMLAMGIWYGLGIESNLDPRDLFPSDSYILDFIAGLDEYGGGGSESLQIFHVYFRDVNVSDPDVQDQMKNYVSDLQDMPYVTSPPVTFWLRDFDAWSQGSPEIQELDFASQLDEFLSIPIFNDFYANDIIRDEDGLVKTSRTYMAYDKVDAYNVTEQLDAFQLQRNITKAQEINGGSLDGNFFTVSQVYYLWELWLILGNEVLVTIALSLVSVFVIGLIFIPHPIGSFLLTPIVAAIFIEVLAVLRLGSLDMNPLTAIGLITCLGLVVDYSIHICLTYFEIKEISDRNKRVEKVLETMGVSIFKGGLTTLLGVLLLSLNPTLSFKTIFVTFIGITTLGVSHGLILLPVLLSIFGPMDDVKGVKTDDADDHNGTDYPE